MMEDINTDQLSKDILANSSLEISNPLFSSMVMNKIMRKEKQRSVGNYILLCSLAMIVVSVIILLSLRPGHAAGPALPAGFDSFNNSILINMTNAGNWFMGNLYLVLPVFVLLLVKMIIDSRLKHY